MSPEIILLTTETITKCILGLGLPEKLLISTIQMTVLHSKSSFYELKCAEVAQDYKQDFLNLKTSLIERE